jgi:hypothetical protein
MPPNKTRSVHKKMLGRYFDAELARRLQVVPMAVAQWNHSARSCKAVSNDAANFGAPLAWLTSWRWMWRGAISTGTPFGFKINTMSGCAPLGRIRMKK